MFDMEQISVIIPIYKVEAYLDKCVASVVGQTYRNLQIILVDDGSPDNCGALCDQWAQKDSRITVVHKENGGLSDARNAGLAVATGALVSFIDSDDWIDPDFLQTLYDAMTAQDAQIAECAIRLVDEEGNVLRTRGSVKTEAVDKLEALKLLVKEDGIYQTVWNKLYRRQVLEGILFAKGKYNEDDFWTYQVFDRSQRLALLDKPMYNYLQRGSSIMGVGYNLRRLDGMEARFMRMEYLQKYEELTALVCQQLVFDYLWHLQAASRHLKGKDRKYALDTLMSQIRRIPKVPASKLTLGSKYRLWYRMFCVAPMLTAGLRNMLRIGL